MVLKNKNESLQVREGGEIIPRPRRQVQIRIHIQNLEFLQIFLEELLRPEQQVRRVLNFNEE